MVAKLKSNLLLVLAAVALLWAVAVVNLNTEHHLNTWGILPRTVTGLRGIPLSPFLHGNLSHLLVNTVPFLVLGGLVALQGRRTFLGVSLVVIGCGGVALWLFGRAGYHIGASGLIFGYFGYLVARAWYDRSLWSILVALVTLFFYDGLVWGVLPPTPTSLGKATSSACWQVFSPRVFKARAGKINPHLRNRPKRPSSRGNPCGCPLGRRLGQKALVDDFLPGVGATLVVAHPRRNLGQKALVDDFLPGVGATLVVAHPGAILDKKRWRMISYPV